jgi:UDP-glucose 4-epimerase
MSAARVGLPAGKGMIPPIGDGQDDIGAVPLAGGRLLVTGAGGFIGSAVCGLALADGATVHGVSRRERRSERGGVRWERADLSEIDAVRRVMHAVRPQAVVHLASEVTGRRDMELVLATLHSNLVAAVSVMVAAAETGCRRVVIAGSMEEPAPGEAGAALQSPYAAAKWMAHLYARMLHGLYGVPVVHLRIFMVYGPGQSDTTKLVPYVITSLLRDEPPQLMSGARPVDWIYVDDVARALLTASTAAGVEGRSFDVGSGELVTVRAVVDRLAAIVGRAAEPHFGALDDRRHEPVRRAGSPGAARLPGWRPLVELEEGLQRTVAFYRDRLAD